MGGLYICCFYQLINKEAAWAYDRAEQSKTEIPSRDRGEKKTESERRNVAVEGDRHPGTLLVNHEPRDKNTK